LKRAIEYKVNQQDFDLQSAESTKKERGMSSKNVSSVLTKTNMFEELALCPSFAEPQNEGD
jgi:hypothetical protein